VFRFIDSANAPMTGGVLHPLLEWTLPAALGGVRRWSASKRTFTLGADEYAPYGFLGGIEPPQAASLPTDNENWSFVLSDPEGEWQTRLKTFAGGSKAVLRAMLVDEATVSANAMTLAVGWVLSATPVESEDEGRIVSVLLSNEFGVEQRDASLPMTHDTERSVSAVANSLKQAGKTAALSWGGTQGTRRD